MKSIVVLATVGILTLCLVVHYEVLYACNRYLPLLMTRRRRPRVLILMFTILAAHIAEIWLFAGGYALLVGVLGLGELGGLPDAQFLDFVYFSAMTYTTVGFGDVVPVGDIRFLAGTEGLVGLVMITWSASYTFLEMQRDWRPS